MKEKIDTDRTNQTVRTSTPEDATKKSRLGDVNDMEELSDADLEQVAGGGDGSSTWTPS